MYRGFDARRRVAGRDEGRGKPTAKIVDRGRREGLPHHPPSPPQAPVVAVEPDPGGVAAEPSVSRAISEFPEPSHRSLVAQRMGDSADERPWPDDRIAATSVTRPGWRLEGITLWRTAAIRPYRLICAAGPIGNRSAMRVVGWAHPGLAVADGRFPTLRPEYRPRVGEIEPNRPSTSRSSRPRDRPRPGSLSGLCPAVVSCPYRKSVVMESRQLRGGSKSLRDRTFGLLEPGKDFP